MLRQGLAVLLLSGGALFFLAALVGLFRFPDAFNRIHAVTKADTAGLILLAGGVAAMAASFWTLVRLGLIVLLVMAGSATTATLISRAARQPGSE